jgi:transcription-repair coupling factor (superfamily II helicase)
LLKPSSSLALRSLLKTTADKAGLSKASPRLTGLTPAAVALHASALAQDSPVVLVVPTDADVEQVVTDARFFLAALRGLGETDASRQVLPFPSLEIDPYRGLAPHLEVASARARALYGLATGTAPLIVASARALLPRLGDPARLAAEGLIITPGSEISPQDLGERLGLAGFVREDPVDEHGEFCVRGGVVDFYPSSEEQPVRLEFIGDIVESIRKYDAATQRSLAALDQIAIVPQREQVFANEEDADRSATFVDYVRLAGASLLVFERDDVEVRGRKLDEQWRASAAEMRARGRDDVPPFETLAVAWDDIAGWLASGRQISQLAIDTEIDSGSRFPPQEGESEVLPGKRLPESISAAHISCQPAIEYRGRIADWVEDIRQARDRGEMTVFVAVTPGRAERAIELLADYEIRARDIGEADDLASASVLVTTGQLSRGFSLPKAGIRFFAETDLFEEERRAYERRRSAARSFISDFRDLKVGDLVVHVDNGIGRFVGLKRLSLGGPGAEQEFMELRYAGDDKLFVPLDRLDLIQKYTGGANPALDRLGGTTWEKTKGRVKKAMRDMAEELLKLYAARKAVVGHAFTPGSHWQQEFDDAFAYDLTPDQQSAIADITRDMESPTPMDRLLCGDVGYGKTEVAMRAAFKAVLDAKQVAFLAPTTVLAFQHQRTLQERFGGFPVRIEMISRFRSPSEVKQTLANLAGGQVDIIVGTHRLLSKDVKFRDLGLLVVDEEQRFGVTHKERLKQLRKKVDVLTMTATPIPRTLNMSLAGIRDMSVIETPPRDRLSIQTHVVRFEQDVITRAIRTELERGGQVYLVHNRVESIFSMANLVQRLVPEAKVGVGHGQMADDELERVMVDFVGHKYDVLVATTIVENGLDIPNANTIVINRADRYGLAQLYQLRGRVGRSDRRAYAYLLIPAEQTLSPVARRRLAAIREFSDLGSGFRIAALDLEIRGAGNLLGGEQSGQIEAIGFDTYMKLLEETVRELKGEEIEDDRRAAVNLKLDLRIDETYIPDMNQRLAAYRRLASARTGEEVEALVAELRDRYGTPPASVRNLAEYAHIRVTADLLGLESLDREGAIVVLKFRPEAKLDPAWLFRLIQSRKDLTLLPPAVLRLNLESSGSKTGPRAADESWWTSKATATEVSSGFSREAVEAEAARNTTPSERLFERLRQVLQQLSQGLLPS